MKFLMALTTLLMCIGHYSHADTPGTAYQYKQYSEDEVFYFKSIPFDSYGDTEFGKTVVYDAKTNEELYQLNRYFPSQSFLGNETEDKEMQAQIFAWLRAQKYNPNLIPENCDMWLFQGYVKL